LLLLLNLILFHVKQISLNIILHTKQFRTELSVSSSVSPRRCSSYWAIITDFLARRGSTHTTVSFRGNRLTCKTVIWGHGDE